MFKRRHEPNPLSRVRDLLWPRTGWRRSLSYLAHRVRRLPGTPYSIAAGFACGAAVSFTPLIGLHFVLAALLAWRIGGNLLASAIGTVVGNPWTFPFIWLWIYEFGGWMLGMGGNDLPAGVGFASVFDHLTFIFDHPGKVFLPMLVGSLPTALVAWFVFYWPLLGMVEGYRRRGAKRRRGKARMPRSAQEAGS